MPSLSASSGEPPPVESWKLCQTLKGHSADVSDLAWSPLGDHLATTSVDNTAQVWAVGSEGMVGSSLLAPWQMAAQLRGHTGYVKGVTWDPVGKFLATQSDDKSVIVRPGRARAPPVCSLAGELPSGAVGAPCSALESTSAWAPGRSWVSK